MLGHKHKHNTNTHATALTPTDPVPVEKPNERTDASPLLLFLALEHSAAVIMRIWFDEPQLTHKKRRNASESRNGWRVLQTSY